MKVLLINGSPRRQGNTHVALQEVAAQLAKNGIESEEVWLGVKPVRNCIACNRCKEKMDNRCVFDDDLCNAVSAKMHAADALIVGSPVYYGQPNGGVLSLVQRMFYSAGALFQNKPAAAVTVCRRAGVDDRRAVFDRRGSGVLFIYHHQLRRKVRGNRSVIQAGARVDHRGIRRERLLLFRSRQVHGGIGDMSAERIINNMVVRYKIRTFRTVVRRPIAQSEIRCKITGCHYSSFLLVKRVDLIPFEIIAVKLRKGLISRVKLAPCQRIEHQLELQMRRDDLLDLLFDEGLLRF